MDTWPAHRVVESGILSASLMAAALYLFLHGVSGDTCATVNATRQTDAHQRLTCPLPGSTTAPREPMAADHVVWSAAGFGHAPCA
ncbi:hypothetical protein [Acidovorax radicis]|uniref:hypothetical protein n=1 Tax=Acidovorax radicis TaxID=758826 RepID=UPI001CF84CD5|nr:hypothetical protein [Acidovorax radicis]UCU98327.1 hypothetical protein KI609_17675 [Acidovorax radicis]